MIKCKLGEIAQSQTGPFGSQLHEQDYVIEGTPIVTVEHLGDVGFTMQNLPCVSGEDTVRLSKYKLEEGDIVFSRVGSVDRCVYTQKEQEGWLFSGRCLRVRCNEEKVNARYLSYYFKLAEFKKMMSNVSVGATMPSLNTDLMNSVQLILLERGKQDKIAQLLDAIDSKINCNNRINAELEAMAKAIYDYWFLQFDFPDENGNPYKSSGGEMVWNEELQREIPKGWNIEKLKDILVKSSDTITPLKAKGYPYTPMDTLPCNKMSFGSYKSGEEANSSLLLYHKYAILFGSMRAYFHRVCIAPFDGVTRTTTFVLYPKNKDYLGYAFETLNLKSTVNYAVSNSIGTQQPYAVWEDNLDSLMLPKVPDKLKLKYSNIIEKIIVTVIHNENESKELSVLRDFLLPLLMNGQVGFKEE